MASLRRTSAARRRPSSSRRVWCRRRRVFTRAISSSRLTGLERKSSAPASMPRTRLPWSSSAVTRTTGINAVAGSALSRSQTSKPLMPGIITSSSTRSGGVAAMCASAPAPSYTASTLIASFASRRPKNATMSGSSSTTRTRNAFCVAASRSAAARSLICDFDLGQVVGIARDAGFQRGAVAAARTVLDLLADDRDAGEAVGIADAFHPVPELAQLLEIGRGERHAQGIDLLVAILEKHRNEVFEILRDDDF